MPSQNGSALIQDESSLIQDESTLIQDESALIQDLAVAHTADIRRYMLGKSVQMPGMLWQCIAAICLIPCGACGDEKK